MIAYEAHYHKSCKSKALRSESSHSMSYPNDNVVGQDAALAKVVSILEVGFSEGKVYAMDDILHKYNTLLLEKGNTTPSTSRTLRKKLSNHFGSGILFRKQRNPSHPILLFPSVSAGEAVEALKIATDKVKESEMEMDDTDDHRHDHQTLLHSFHHVASVLHNDLKNTPGHKGYDNLNVQAAEKCVPDSLYLLLKWIISGDIGEDEWSADNSDDHQTHQAILNIGQTLLYSMSKGKKNTPKHIGTALLVHHTTRSKQLIDYLHGAGDSIGYETVRRVDTSIAQKQLSRYTANNNVFIPENIVPDRFVQFAADNLDILEETLDGKGTFHVTQMAAFQRGPKKVHEAQDTIINRERSLKDIPHDMTTTTPVALPPKRISPQFKEPVKPEWYSHSEEMTKQYQKKDLTWVCSRSISNDDQKVPSWTAFNQEVTNHSPAQSVVGYMPIIPAPAHEMDTLMTVLLRCKQVTESLGQTVTVVTLDQALFCRARELLWLCPEMLDKVVVRLGGFHISMNYLGVLGQHFAHSGLSDAWISSGVYGKATTEQILKGKSWNRAVRAHKLTFDALFRLFLKQFKEWQEEQQRTSFEDFSQHALLLALQFDDNSNDKAEGCSLRETQCLTHMDDFCEDLEEFVDSNQGNGTFVYWMQYFNMVGALLRFIRAEREGNWNLHINSFQEMLPLMTLYDHTNYTRWGTIYLADMQQLPETAPEVHSEFMDGNFVVKESEGRFNQVSPDQALEHINKKCKSSGGLVGITRTESALNRWMLTCSDHARLSDDIHAMVGASTKHHGQRKENPRSRKDRDEKDVVRLEKTLEEFNPFGRQTNELMCISTNDVAPPDVKTDLLSAVDRGQTLLKEFVDKRLCANLSDFHEPISKNKSKTFATMHTAFEPKDAKSKTAKADRDLFRRLLSAASSGRQIELEELLKHELAPVPPALATADGSLRHTDKAVLLHILADDHAVKDIPPPEQLTCIIIDGMALVQSIGKPSTATTFGDLADVFCACVLQHLHGMCSRVDVVFDTYVLTSIKSATRAKRASKKRKIRRVIESRDILLPPCWDSFISMEQNKVDLIQFLTQQLLVRAESLPLEKEINIAGGCTDPQKVVSSQGKDLDHLFSTQEEADTKMILHAQDAAKDGYKRVEIISRDTDVLVLLVFHSGAGQEIWMRAGTSRKPFNIPVHMIKLSAKEISALPAFHAITGCDSTSQFHGHGKKSAWKTFQTHHELLQGHADGDLASAEVFVVKLYNASSGTKCINSLRLEMFHKVNDPEKLPPTKDALVLHLKRSQYQTSVWHTATTAKPDLPPIEEHGWQVNPDKTVDPILMSKNSVPEVCTELLTCRCKTSKCTSGRCTCKKNELPCSAACLCSGRCQNPKNLSNETVSDSDED